MKRFKFRLERVLRHRTTVREERARVLLAAIAALREAEAQLEQLENAARISYIDEGSIVSAEQLAVIGSFSARLHHELEAQRARIAQRTQEVEEARQEYLLAAQEEEALVKLRERRAAEYREKVLKHEEQFLDDLTTMRAGREPS